MRKSRRAKLPQNTSTFVDKLILILEDESCHEYIQWTQDEDSFVIKDITKFTELVLPKYFKHSNFSSFIRQLNMYGFNKIRHQQGENVYKNQNFLRNQEEQLKSIKRKIHPQNQKQDRVVLYSPDNSLSKQLKQLKNKQNNLEMMCEQMIAQNKKILEENNKIMKDISTNQYEKSSKIEQILVSLIMAKGGGQQALPHQNDGRPLLSITNNDSQHSGSVDAENFLELQDHKNKIQEALKLYQTPDRRKKHSKNYTIVNPPQENLDEHPDENRSMYSLSDFLNIDSPNEQVD